MKELNQKIKRAYFFSFSSFSSSAVLSTFTLDCFLNAFSSDQIAQFSANASAKYGSSFVFFPCGDILLASDKNDSYISLEKDSIFFSSKEKNIINSSSLIPEYFCISSLSLVSSSKAK